MKAARTFSSIDGVAVDRCASPDRRSRQARDGDHGRFARPPLVRFVGQREVAVRHRRAEVHLGPGCDDRDRGLRHRRGPNRSSPAASQPASISARSPATRRMTGAARAERNVLALQPVRIAGAVEALVVVADCGHGVVQEAEAVDDACPSSAWRCMFCPAASLPSSGSCRSRACRARTIAPNCPQSRPSLLKPYLRSFQNALSLLA